MRLVYEPATDQYHAYCFYCKWQGLSRIDHVVAERDGDAHDSKCSARLLGIIRPRKWRP